MDSVNEIAVGVYFPLPYRVMALGGLGIIGWATNIHFSSLLGVDIVSAMELGPSELPSSRLRGFRALQDPVILARPLYRLFFVYSTLCFVSWLAFLNTTRGDSSLVDRFGFIPGLTVLGLMLILISPFNIIFKRERDNFLQAINRCLFSSSDKPVYFADVVFADIFTSFAKVLGDVWLSALMVLPGNSLLIPPADNSILRWVMPSIVSLPYLTRLRQCLVEYNSPSCTSPRPLYNAVKYATSFPVIFLSAAQRIVVLDLIKENDGHVPKDGWHGEHRLFRLWLLAAIINSLYSFWWDITHDWGLELLKSDPGEERSDRRHRSLALPRLHSGSPLIVVPRSPTSPTQVPDIRNPEVLGSLSRRGIPPPLNLDRRPYPYGLRSTLFYPLPTYPLLIFLNLILRLTWSVKLSSHLHLKTDGSITIFWFEVAEVVRRWMWVFLRVEWELIKKSRESTARLLPDDEESGVDDLDYELIPTPAIDDLDS